MGLSTSNVAHPDLLQLAKFDGDLFDLRVIYLERPLSDCVFSSVRRFINASADQYKDPRWQARSVQESLTVINNALPLLKCGKLMKIKFDV